MTECMIAFDSRAIQKSIATALLTDHSLLAHKRNLYPKLLLRSYYKVFMSFSCCTIKFANNGIMLLCRTNAHTCNLKSTVTKGAYCTRFYLPILPDSDSSTHYPIFCLFSQQFFRQSFCTQIHVKLVLASRSWMKP